MLIEFNIAKILLQTMLVITLRVLLLAQFLYGFDIAEYTTTTNYHRL